MSELLSSLYQLLPSPVRSIVASARGLQLQVRRFGRDTEQLIAESLERECWSPERWRTWQGDQLATLLAFAARTVPFYRDYWRAHGGGAEARQDLSRWPIITKSDVRAFPDAFRSSSGTLRQYREITSGSTGTPLELWHSRSTLKRWYALTEARARGWYGVDRVQRWGHLGGQPVISPARQSPPYWVWNQPMHQLYLSSYHIAPATAAAYLDALRRYRVCYLLGYPSSLCALARAGLDAGLEPPPLQVVITDSEPLYDHQRSDITAFFCCPVRETYGTAELVCAASECHHDRLHLWPEVGVAEILDDLSSKTAQSDVPGRLVCTGLLNTEMPLIRYETGDRVLILSQAASCGCGRSLPQLGRIEGRLDDVIVTEDGRRIGRLDSVFKDRLPIQEAQVVQEAPARFRIRVVPMPQFGQRHASLLRSRFRRRIGARIDVTVELVDRIERGRCGKFRGVVAANAAATSTR